MTALARMMTIGALGALLGTAACGDDLILSAYNLEIGPTPARPGDTVVASFFIDLLPIQAHTIRIMVDGTEHLSVETTEAPSNPILLELGDAEDLIETFGTGDHVVHVEVRVGSDLARSQSALLQLEQDTP